jgi:hypothetical protein
MLMIRAGRGRAAGAGDHAAGNLLRDEEGAPGIGVEDEVVVFLADVDQLARVADPRVVDEDVDGARLGLGTGHGRTDARDIGDVEGHDVCGAAFGLDLGAQLLEPLGASRREHDLRTIGCERAREARAQAAGGAGDEGNLSCEVEGGRHGGGCRLAAHRAGRSRPGRAR